MSDDALHIFSPRTAEWFAETFGEPTAVQKEAWPAIAAGGPVLVSAPTGTGKTLSAFLVFLDRFQTMAKRGELEEKLYLIYVSPLKSLAADIRENLERPLQGILPRREGSGRSPAEEPAISVGVRTGDTGQRERQRMIRRPPHILITTPESLYLMLTSRSGQKMLGTAQAVILDELHALIDSKRGAHLLLSLARLDALCGRNLQRIGLSATIRPLSLAAEWLSPERAAIVAPPMEKKVEIRVRGCIPSAGGRKNPLWEELARMVYERCQGKRSVIAFLEGRRYAEKLAWFVNQLGGPDFARVHHGSLSREQRQETETALREGRLRLLCATSSMELGIDVGEVDEVIQVGCPATVSSAMQRLGRAGHNPGRVSVMDLYPRTAPEGILCGMTAVLACRGGVEEACPPRRCLDVLAQHLVSMAASCESAPAYRVDDVMKLLGRAWPFADVEPEAVKRVLSMLAGGYEHRQEIPARPRVIYDPVREAVYGDAYSRMLAVAAGGTIPDRGMFAARTPEGVKVGELDEEFVYESRIGDRFLLGAFGWKIIGQDRDTVFVEQDTAQGARLPFWKGETRGRGLKTSLAFGRMMGQLGRAGENGRKQLLIGMGLDDAAADSAAELIRRQLRATGAMPDDKTVVAEHFRDHTGKWQVMFHAPFGRRVLAPLCLLAQYTLRERFGINAGGVEEDGGFLLYGYGEERLPEGILMSIDPDVAPDALRTLLLQTPLFGMTFRYNAARALMLGMKQNHRQPLWSQRLKGAQLLDRAVREADHPLVEETVRECLEDQWDLEGLSWFFSSLHAGLIAVRETETEVPSPLSLPLQWQTEAAEMYSYSPVTQGVRQAVSEGLKELSEGKGREGGGGVRPSREALQKEQERRRLPEDSLQLYALLQMEGDLRAGDLEVPALWLKELAESGRAIYREPGLWIAAEQAQEYETALAEKETGESVRALSRILRRMLYYRGPKRADQMEERYGISPQRVRAALESLGKTLVEEDGLYYHAKRYQRAKRTTVLSLRQEAVTRPASRYAALMARMAASGGGGKERLRDVLKRSVNLSLPASWWEGIVFPARVNGYQPAWLDAVLAEGDFSWRITPQGEIRFASAEATDWDADAAWQEEGLGRCENDREKRVYGELLRRGASFLKPLSACLDGESAQETLLSLAQKGLVCADSFVPVRQWLDREKLAKAPARQRVSARVMAMSAGRWDAVRPAKGISPEEWLEELLSTRLILCRETFRKFGQNPAEGRDFSWPDALRILGVWEYAGKVRRGYFVEGLSGAQYIREEDYGAVMQALAAPDPGICWLNAADPAQVWGKCLPHGEGRSFANLSTTAVALKEGRPAALLERKGSTLRVLEEEHLDEALNRLAADFREKRIFSAQKRLVVKEYPSFAADAFKKAGFQKEMQDWALYR